MKAIFDFDDVLFSTKDFKEILFSGMEKFGISKKQLSDFYLVSTEEFNNPKSFYASFVSKNKINVSEHELDEVVGALFVGLDKLLNQELIKVIKELGVENCFIVSMGNNEFQMNKIKGCNIEGFFNEIHIVGEEKNSVIEKLMNKFNNDYFVFIDNNLENIENAKKIEKKGQKLHAINFPQDIEKFMKLVRVK